MRMARSAWPSNGKLDGQALIVASQTFSLRHAYLIYT